MQRGLVPWREAMNVLGIVRKQTQKKEALKAAQMAAVKAQAVKLVYRGVAYRIAK
mgnify:CR=1 FL=1|tara:strand:+ start:43 stop:207 length:165 start_codon:yes stop_codon:yes gene_type:complete